MLSALRFCPVRTWFCDKVTVFRCDVPGFGLPRLLAVCRSGTVSCDHTSRVLLVGYSGQGLAGSLDVDLADEFGLAVFRSLGLVNFHFGMFNFLFRCLPVCRG